jgi:uncharacterized protein (DUF2267 family)
MTPTAFNKYADQGNLFLNQLSDELNMAENKPRTLRILKAVFHAIRNRISAEESTHFIAQLPMVLKALYVDGWKIGQKTTHRSTHQDFIEDVYQLSGGAEGAFKRKDEVERYVRAVLDSLSHYISEGEMADIAAMLPPQLRPYFQQYRMEGQSVFY